MNLPPELQQRLDKLIGESVHSLRVTSFRFELLQIVNAAVNRAMEAARMRPLPTPIPAPVPVPPAIVVSPPSDQIVAE